MKQPRQFKVQDEMQCPDCKVGLMPSDESMFFCCSCGVCVDKKSGTEILPDWERFTK